MALLTSEARIYLNDSTVQQIYSLYKTDSAENHATADDGALKQALIAGLNAAVGPGKIDQGGGSYRFSINSGRGYIVYKTPSVVGVARSAAIYHYHWNYNLDGSHKAKDGT